MTRYPLYPAEREYHFIVYSENSGSVCEKISSQFIDKHRNGFSKRDSVKIKNMNVLIGILMYPPDFTGAGLRIHRLYSNLRKKGVNKVYVITNSISKIEKRTKTYDGIEIIYIGCNKYAGKQTHIGKKFLKTMFVLRIFLRTTLTFFKLQSEIDIIHTVDSSWLSSLIGWYALVIKKPLVKEIVSLGIDDPLTLRETKLPLIKYFFLFPFHSARLVIVISPPLKDACIKYGLSSDKIWCRFNPIYLDGVNEEDDKNEVLSYVDFSAHRILWVGVIIRRKNLEFLLNAAFYLKGKVQLIIVGPHPDEDYFREIVSLSETITQETNGRINISFLGRIDDRKELVTLYKNSQLFWFASHHEGLGNVVIESLLCGTPIVTLPVNNIMNYVIQNTEDGEVVNTDDPRYFADIVNKCLHTNTYDRDKIAERAKKRFNHDQIENEYVFKFNDIMRLKTTDSYSRKSL